MGKKTTWFVFVCILALGAFFRFFMIAEAPPGLYPDEAMNGNNALEALETRDFKIFYTENNGREGFYINVQALSLALFGNEPWALRGVSALFGTLTILGVYLLARKLFEEINPKHKAQNPKQYTNLNVPSSKPFGFWILDFGFTRGELIALLSSFFLATSFWHINFSRIGFRAILVPFFATFGIYFLLKGLREGKIFPLVWAGIFIGLGFHTYIAFRFIPFVIAAPILWYMWIWWKKRGSAKSCAPCLVALFLFVTFVTALPIGWYFLQNPGDFLGRATDVSIFSAESPLVEFSKSNIATLGMFFARGDCNWRHNLNCQPFLLLGILGAVGTFAMWRAKLRKEFAFLALWIFFLMFPSTLTREGLPHALRSIGMIPPAVIFAGFGAWSIIQFALEWLEKQKTPHQNKFSTGQVKWPRYTGQLSRIRKEVIILFVLLLLTLPVMTYRQYFVKWANNANTYFAFTTDIYNLGQFLDALPDDVNKYVVVNLPGVDIRGIPAPAQTVMFATNTFREKKHREKNIRYISSTDSVGLIGDRKTVIAFLNGDDRELIAVFQKENPGLRVKVPGDFVILEN